MNLLVVVVCAMALILLGRRAFRSSTNVSSRAYSRVSSESPTRRERAAAMNKPSAPNTTPSGLWIPPGERVTVAGRPLEGGMVFVGKGLRALHGRDFEPALIDPSLTVSAPPGDQAGDGLPYWLSYSHIEPAQRSAYLEW